MDGWDKKFQRHHRARCAHNYVFFVYVTNETCWNKWYTFSPIYEMQSCEWSGYTMKNHAVWRYIVPNTGVPWSNAPEIIINYTYCYCATSIIIIWICWTYFHLFWWHTHIHHARNKWCDGKENSSNVICVLLAQICIKRTACECIFIIHRIIVCASADVIVSTSMFIVSTANKHFSEQIWKAISIQWKLRW